MYDGIATVQKFQVIIIIFLFYFILFKLYFNILVRRIICNLFVTSRDYILRVQIGFSF